MKKGILLLAACLMLAMAGCGQQSPAETSETTQAPSAEPATEAVTVPETEPIPKTEEGEILADHVPTILAFANRGDLVNVVGEYDELHMAVKLDIGYGLVEKNFLRMDGADPYEPWTGYARWNTGFYDNFYLSGEPLQKLSGNQKVEVLEDLGTCYMIRIQDIVGYVPVKQIGKSPSVGNGGGSSGGGGGGSSGQDGGDITMQDNVTLIPLSIIEQTGEVRGKAEILADGTPIVIGYFDRGETVPVVTEAGFHEELAGYRLLYWDGIYAYVQIPFVHMAGDPQFTQWDGYVGRNGKAYDNYLLTGEPLGKVWVNVPVHVICDLGDVYLVQINDAIAYMAKGAVSEKKVIVNSGGGSSGGSGGGQEWSDPVL